jgi:hypothetical protein
MGMNEREKEINKYLMNVVRSEYVNIWQMNE